MWAIVILVAWLAFGYLGARYCFYDTGDPGLSIIIFMAGPIGALVSFFVWLDNRPTTFKKNRKNFWQTFYHVKDKR